MILFVLEMKLFYQPELKNPGKRVEWFDDENSNVSIFMGFDYTTSPLAFWQTYYVEAVSGENCRSERVMVQGKTFNNAPGMIQVSAQEVELPNSDVNFDLVGATRIAGYLWNFGDGGSSDQKNPTYTFNFPGRYEVKLNTISENGCEKSINSND